MTFMLHTQEHHHIFFNDFIDSDETSIVFKFRTSPIRLDLQSKGLLPKRFKICIFDFATRE